MITKVYFLDDTRRTHVTLDLLEKEIPCFTSRDKAVTYPNCIAYTIQCRAEDVATVERRLAKII